MRWGRPPFAATRGGRLALGAAFATPTPAARPSRAPPPAPPRRGRPSPSPQRPRGRGSAKFRFWHDERRFKGPSDRCVVQQALFGVGGVRTGGYPKAAPLPGPLGFQRPGDWDFLWSPARTALKAVPSLKPGQLVSALPGMMSITKKVGWGWGFV
jgi:hypothetical protein